MTTEQLDALKVALDSGTSIRDWASANGVDERRGDIVMQFRERFGQRPLATFFAGKLNTVTSTRVQAFAMAFVRRPGVTLEQVNAAISQCESALVILSAKRLELESV